MRTLLVSLSTTLMAFLLIACNGVSSPPDKAALTTESSGAASQQLILNTATSTLTFISVKNNSIGEVHRFDEITGHLHEGQGAQLNINLATVNTGIDIRNQRMSEHLFDTAQFSQATVVAALKDTPFTALNNAGQQQTDQITVSIDLHGVKTNLDATVNVTRLANDGLLVQSAQPLIINANSFGLTAGIAKLQELAGLSSISSAIPVSFSLQFDPAL